MSKKDDELKVTDGAYNLSCVEVIFKLVNQRQVWGDERIKKIVAALAVEGIKICIVFVCMRILFTIYFLGYFSTVYFGQVRTQ